MIKLTVAIPSYGREQVLIDSIASLLVLSADSWELLLVDQTPAHDPAVEQQLQVWQSRGQLRWIRLSHPSITEAMNHALQEASGDRVLFLDDDIIPDPELLQAHQIAAAKHRGALIAGRVLQPWHQGRPDPSDYPFRFNSLKPVALSQFMGGNFSLPRVAALNLGGFDQNFVKVAYRFEAEFAYRWLNAGHEIYYDPKALIHHLRAERGGTRSYGQHLTTAQPSHAVGRYYFLLRTLPLPTAVATTAGAMALSICSRHHLHRPWWIPLTLLSEFRGLFWALRLHCKGPRLLHTNQKHSQQLGA